MPQEKAPSRRSDRHSAARIALIYLTLSFSWILLSDRLIIKIVGPTQHQRERLIQTGKGLLFVGFTAWLIYFLISRRLRQVRRAEADTRSTRYRLEAFADNLPGIAYVKDREGRYVFVRGQALPGDLTLEAMINKTDRQLFDAALAERVSALDQTLFETGQLSQVIETTHFAGQSQHWLVQRFPLEDGSGQPILGGIAIDVTERQEAAKRIRQLVQELEQANRMKDTFLSNLSHELRTPITAIRLWTEVLRTSKAEDAETIREAAAMIRHSAVTQTLLIEDLLDVTRIIGGRLKVELKPMRLAEVVGRTAELLQPMAQERLVTLRTELPEGEDCPMVGDARRVQQVAWNLLTNAIKFSRGGGEVVCRLNRDKEAWALTVTDQGVGIRADQMPHVFDRFRQAQSTRTQPEGGVGIGLSIVKHLVEAHNGSVSASSDGEGQGATFVARFPAESENQPRRVRRSDEPSPSAAPAKPLVGKRILYVEDNSDSRTGLSLLLSRFGAQVVGCETVDQALSAEEPFDLLLSDIGLPDRDGCDLIRELRVRPEWAKRPAVALSAFAMPEDRARAMEAGYDEFVVKPIDVDTLIRVLTDRLSQAAQAEG